MTAGIERPAWLTGEVLDLGTEAYVRSEGSWRDALEAILLAVVPGIIMDALADQYPTPVIPGDDWHNSWGERPVPTEAEAAMLRGSYDPVGLRFVRVDRLTNRDAERIRQLFTGGTLHGRAIVLDPDDLAGYVLDPGANTPEFTARLGKLLALCMGIPIRPRQLTDGLRRMPRPWWKWADCPAGCGRLMQGQAIYCCAGCAAAHTSAAAFTGHTDRCDENHAERVEAARHGWHA